MKVRIHVNPIAAIGLGLLILAVLILLAIEWREVRAIWRETVGAWFARRRTVGRFTERRYRRIRINEPDMHSPGIMASRRDVNTGVWT